MRAQPGRAEVHWSESVSVPGQVEWPCATSLQAGVTPTFTRKTSPSDPLVTKWNDACLRCCGSLESSDAMQSASSGLRYLG